MQMLGIGLVRSFAVKATARDYGEQVWQVKLVTELEPGAVSETQLAYIERDGFAAPEAFGLILEEGMQLTAVTQARVYTDVSNTGGRSQRCEHWDGKPLSTGCYYTLYRSVPGYVNVKGRRLWAGVCCAGAGEARSFAAILCEFATVPGLRE